MAFEIKMPALSPAMADGALAKWHVNEGDDIKPGDVIAEIETAEATVELEAVDAGRVEKILVRAGASGIPVNTPIARITTAPSQTAAIGHDVTAVPRVPPATTSRPTTSTPVSPHIHLTVDCRLDDMLQARARQNRRIDQAGNSHEHLSLADIVIKAFALALQQVPQTNATWVNGDIVHQEQSNIAITVATQSGMARPVICNAEQKSLTDISTEINKLTEQAQSGNLNPGAIEDATASDTIEHPATLISNLGMYGIKLSHEPVTKPYTTALSIGAAEVRPLVIDGGIEPAAMMSCTLSCDVRAMNGVSGAKLLSAFKKIIENPAKMQL